MKLGDFEGGEQGLLKVESLPKRTRSATALEPSKVMGHGSFVFLLFLFLSLSFCRFLTA